MSEEEKEEEMGLGGHVFASNLSRAHPACFRHLTHSLLAISASFKTKSDSSD